MLAGIKDPIPIEEEMNVHWAAFHKIVSIAYFRLARKIRYSHAPELICS